MLIKYYLLKVTILTCFVYENVGVLLLLKKLWDVWLHAIVTLAYETSSLTNLLDLASGFHVECKCSTDSKRALH